MRRTDPMRLRFYNAHWVWCARKWGGRYYGLRLVARRRAVLLNNFAYTAHLSRIKE